MVELTALRILGFLRLNMVHGSEGVGLQKSGGGFTLC